MGAGGRGTDKDAQVVGRGGWTGGTETSRLPKVVVPPLLHLLPEGTLDGHMVFRPGPLPPGPPPSHTPLLWSPSHSPPSPPTRLPSPPPPRLPPPTHPYPGPPLSLTPLPTPTPALVPPSLAPRRPPPLGASRIIAVDINSSKFPAATEWGVSWHGQQQGLRVWGLGRPN